MDDVRSGHRALREQVRDRYAVAATGTPDPQGCDGADSVGLGDNFGLALYSDGDFEAVPEAAARASLGCGNPTAVAELHQGETVLDLGCGGGMDVLLSAHRVGSSGFVYGVDMTAEMIELARRNAAEAGVENVEFLEGEIEQIPLADASVTAIVSNCVINLSADRPAVLSEMYRVLAPSGRIGISDIVAEDRLTPSERVERGSQVGAIAGALSVTEYRVGLQSLGFEEVEIAFTNEVADGLHAAIVRARRPA